MNESRCPFTTGRNTYLEYLADETNASKVEALFKDVHRIHEHEWGLVCEQIRKAIEKLRRGQFQAAANRINPATVRVRTGTEQANLLLRNLTVPQFEKIRKQFLPNAKFPGASGLLSPTFVEMDMLLEQLATLFKSMTIRKQIVPLELYTSRKPGNIFHLSEAIYLLDQAVYEWRQVHLMLVEKFVPEGEKGTGGMTPATVRKRAKKRHYSEITKLRKQLFRDLQISR